MQDLPLQQVAFHPLSSADPGACLFTWNDRLYRGLDGPRSAFFTRLFQNGVIDALVDRRLIVETEPTDLALSGCDLVVAHRRVPFVSYMYEWCPAMLRDAALLTVDLALALNEHDLTLFDAHPWNIVFDGPSPVFVDLGSIVPIGGGGSLIAFRDWFRRRFMRPLRLLSHGRSGLARLLVQNPSQAMVVDDYVDALEGRSLLSLQARRTARALRASARSAVPARWRPAVKRALAGLGGRAESAEPASTRARARLLERLRREVEDVRLPDATAGWVNYYKDRYPPLTSTGEWTTKHHTVASLLSRHRPSSILDMGSNCGWYSQLAASRDIPVVAIDNSEDCVARLYDDAKAKQLPILPLVMDVCEPSPGLGVCNKALAPATERLACDTVLALALVHHLSRKYRLDQVVDTLAIFSRRSLVVEFVSKTDTSVGPWWPIDAPWYTLENLRAALGRHFSTIEELPSHPDTRTILFCER